MVGTAITTGMPAKAVGPQEPAAGEAHARDDLARQIVAAEAAVAAHPGDPDWLLRLVVLYDRKGEFKKSIPLLEKLMRLQPNNPDVYRRSGIDRFHTGHPEEALGPLRTVVHADPEDMEANFYLGLCYLALDREDEANKVFDRQAATVPVDVDELYLLVKGYSRLSSAMLSRLAALGKDSYRMYQVRGEYFDLQNAPEEAIREYEKAVELRPDLPSLHYVLGSAYWKHSQLDKAMAEFRRTIELEPSHFMAHYKLGMVLLEKNDPSNALKEFRAALAEQPGLIDGYLGAGKALFLQGNYQAALPQLQRYLELSPDDPTRHYLLYQIFRRLNNVDEAERQLELFKQKEDKAKAKEAATVKRPGGN